MTNTTVSLSFPGTGSAFPKQSYNACCIFDLPGDTLMIDAGGGNGIFDGLARTGHNATDITRLVITHVHTDHLLGAVWLLRHLVKRDIDGVLNEERLAIYGNRDVTSALIEICRLTFLPSYFNRIERVASIATIVPGDTLSLASATVKFIDCHSRNVNQTGVRISLHDDMSTSIVCLGDEALTEHNANEAVDADWLICGAFCRYADRDIFRPYEKHHHTVIDVARHAADAHVRNLVLIHCEDRNICERSALYTAESSAVYNGQLHVPVDGDSIVIV